jgi:ATP sulfurylase
LLAHGGWFSPGIPASFTTKTGRHDIAEILMKVALNTKNIVVIALIITTKKSNYFFRF